ncbi:MAG TPA: polyphenol oxidase family protein [Segeticoccus sp.]|uniref:polyphenol oxidase family protein n=1 Tax=Segeticoccus sp. TaxID=2706531 RepID=UPI002D810D52|nr:polyphenol oxidase family protein [Segeticoccus sp.]HET8599686.1 polyphenol oxidase family protein [Segeticoccus sp.]
MYAFRATVGPVDLAFTDRYDGVSGVPFDSLDLALEGRGDSAERAQNLQIVLRDFAPDVAALPDAARRTPAMRQVHGAAVRVVREVADDGPGSEVPEADAMVTALPDVVLLVRAADCVPVVLADPDAGVVGVAHAGRRGVEGGVVPSAVEQMRDLGARELTAWIGPHICGACYEVPAAMQAEVAAVVPETASTTSWGTPALDLGAGVRAQLVAAGATVRDVSRCTREDAGLYSYRRDGERAGRLAGLVRVRR